MKFSPESIPQIFIFAVPQPASGAYRRQVAVKFRQFIPPEGNVIAIVLFLQFTLNF